MGVEWGGEPGQELAPETPIARLHWRDKGRDEALDYLRAELIMDGDVQSRTGRVRAQI